MIATVDWTVIFGGTSLGLIVASIIGWFKYIRKFSGDINKSDADKLWSEASSIRADYRHQLVQLRVELEDCKKVGEGLRRRIAALEAKLRGAR